MRLGGIYVGIMSMGTHSCVSVLVFTRLTKVPGADPEITVRGGGCTYIIQGVLRPPLGPGRSPGWGPGDKAPESSWILQIL